MTRRRPKATALVVRAADVFYVDLTDDVGAADRPWVVSSGHSGSELGRDLAPTLEQYRQVLCPERWAAVVASAADVRAAGKDQLDGAEVMEFRLTVRQPTSSSPAARSTASPDAVPAEVWLDGSGRLRRVHEELSRGGTTTELALTLGGFDSPVEVSASPAAQIRHGLTAVSPCR